MKKRFTTRSIVLLCYLLNANFSYSQCGSGYSQASINWDLLYNNGGYTLGTTGSRFAIGTNSLLLTTTGTITSSGSNGSHTGNAGVSVTGSNDPTSSYDAAFYIGNGSITFNFSQEVTNLSFTIHDLDNGQSMSFDAVNNDNTSQSLSIATLGTTTLSVSGNNSGSASITGASGGVSSSSNNSSATVTVSGSVKSITLTFTKSSGSDNIWISDILGCNSADFPSSYYAIAAPESGQPEYFLVARSNHINIVNATTGAATLLYSDASVVGVNSLASDPTKHVIYYTDEDLVSSNKSIYKYDVKTGTKSTLVSDVTGSPLYLPLSNEGLGSGGATFYNGSLYIGIETTTENHAAGVYRIDFDNSGNATMASRVFSKLGANANGQTLGYGDFVINGSSLYLTDNSSGSSFQIYDIAGMKGTANYSGYKGQMSIGSNGTPRYVDNTPAFASYSGSGNWTSSTTISNGTGSITNDASEVFKYPADYGDAPSSYGTAFHICNATPRVKLGSAIDFENTTYNTSSANGDDLDAPGSVNDEDGVSTLNVLNTNSSTYSVTVNVSNTSGASASLFGWIDFNKNGSFESGEKAGSANNVANNATTVTLTWSNLSGLVGGESFLRLRIGSSSSESSNPIGKASNGEVEDYDLTIKLSISGTVYNDGDGMTESTPLIDGTPVGTVSSSQLYAYLLASDGTIAQKVTLPSNGQYTFSSLDPSSQYSVQISSNNLNVGANAPSTPSLPGSWVSTGENFGVGNGAGSGNETGAANSLISILTGTSNITGVNFGIEKVSTALAKTFSGLSSSSFGTNSGNATFTKKIDLNASSGTADAIVNANSASILPGKLSGSDYEDGNYGGLTGSSGSRKVAFTALPDYNNDVLVYNNGTNILLVPNPSSSDASYTYWNVSNSRYEIPNFNPNNLSVFIKPNGHSGFSFSYAWFDAANFLGSSAQYSVNATSPLPMKLLYFGAEMVNAEVALKFITTNEYNIEKFEIEKSTNMGVWTQVAQIQPKNVYGALNTYRAFDAKSADAVVYYRIKETDFDGALFYSDLVSIRHEVVGFDFSVFPSPAKNGEILNVRFNSKNQVATTLTLSDLKGRVVLNDELPSGENHKAIQLSNIQPGLYFLTATNLQFSKTIKFMVN